MADSAHRIWWQVYPLGFLGAETEALPAGSATIHRLRGVEPWLDYLVELGCNGLFLNPIFASETHGYDTVDHFRIDARLGDDDDLSRLIAACRQRGVRVMLDGVFHHVGRSFPAFKDVLANGQRSPYADWFHIDWNGDDPDGFRYRNFEGHDHLVALNHESPAVVDHVAAVMDHWLDRGIDAWRLDAAYAVPLGFWREVVGRARQRHPDAWFVGEVIHGHYPDWVQKGALDATTQYELWKSTWSSLNDSNFFELAWSLDRHNTFCKDMTPLTFVGNHDVTRIASQLKDSRHLGHALAILLTVPGIPSVYYGDEHALLGVKEDRPGGDDAMRPAFPEYPDELGPRGWPTYRLHQQLIGLRRLFPWVSTGRCEVMHLTNHQLAYDIVGSDGQRLRALLNIGDHDYHFPLESDCDQILSHDDTTRGDNDVGPHGWTIVRPR